MASGMIGWIEAHPDLALAGGAVGVLLIAGSFFKAKTPTVGSTTQDLSGLKNGIVYVPTQTSFKPKTNQASSPVTTRRSPVSPPGQSTPPSPQRQTTRPSSSQRRGRAGLGTTSSQQLPSTQAPTRQRADRVSPIAQGQSNSRPHRGQTRRQPPSTSLGSRVHHPRRGHALGNRGAAHAKAEGARHARKYVGYLD
jgi:hypothetical protein